MAVTGTWLEDPTDKVAVVTGGAGASGRPSRPGSSMQACAW